MFSSTNEVNGFSAIGQEELETVNGGEPILVMLGFAIGVGIGFTLTAHPKNGK